MNLKGSVREYAFDEIRGGRGLGRVVMELIQDVDEVVAWLPDDQLQLCDAYERGALSSEELSQEALRNVAGYLAARHGLGDRRNVTLVLQPPDGPLYPGEATPHNRPFKTLWLSGSDDSSDDGELFAAGNDSDSEAILAALGEALRFPAVGLLVKDDRISTSVSDATIPAAELRSAAVNFEAILIGGWDATNYLILERRRSAVQSANGGILGP